MTGGLLDDLPLEELERMNGELYDQIARLKQRRTDVQGEIEARKQDHVRQIFDTLAWSDRCILAKLLEQHGYCTVAKELE